MAQFLMDFAVDNTPKVRTWKECEELENWAFLYTAGASGHVSGIRFMMSTEDAKVWCSSELSKGCMHGNPWAYFWTTVKNFCSCHWSDVDETLDLSRLVDNREFDQKIKSLGLRKYEKYEIREILEPLGVKVWCS